MTARPSRLDGSALVLPLPPFDGLATISTSRQTNDSTLSPSSLIGAPNAFLQKLSRGKAGTGQGRGSPCDRPASPPPSSLQPEKAALGNRTEAAEVAVPLPRDRAPPVPPVRAASKEGGQLNAQPNFSMPTTLDVQSGPTRSKALDFGSPTILQSAMQPLLDAMFLKIQNDLLSAHHASFEHLIQRWENVLENKLKPLQEEICSARSSALSTQTDSETAQAVAKLVLTFEMVAQRLDELPKKTAHEVAALNGTDENYGLDRRAAGSKSSNIAEKRNPALQCPQPICAFKPMVKPVEMDVNEEENRNLRLVAVAEQGPKETAEAEETVSPGHAMTCKVIPNSSETNRTSVTSLKRCSDGEVGALLSLSNKKEGSDGKKKNKVKRQFFGMNNNDTSSVFRSGRDSALDTKDYDVKDLYHDKGVMQKIARSPIFDNITVAFIAVNTLYIGVEIDRNKAHTIYQSHIAFIVCENLFAVFFTAELLVRFGAFAVKRSCLTDTWFVFDLALVGMMFLDTYIIPAMSDGGLALPFNITLLRLLRLFRFGRLMRGFPAIAIMIKGLVLATKAVTPAVMLMTALVYVFALLLRIIMDGTGGVCANPDAVGGDSEAAKHYRMRWQDGLLMLMWTLVTNGTLLDSFGQTTRDLITCGGKLPLFILVIFVFLSAMVVINMLIGVVVEVVSKVSHGEREAAAVNLLKSRLLEMLNQLDEDQNQRIAEDEMTGIINNEDAVLVLEELHVCPGQLMRRLQMKYAFQDQEDGLSVQQIMELVLEMRGDRQIAMGDLLRESAYNGWRTEKSIRSLQADMLLHFSRTRMSEMKQSRDDDASAQKDYLQQKGPMTKSLEAESTTETDFAELQGAVEILHQQNHQQQDSEEFKTQARDLLGQDCSWLETHFSTRRDQRKAELDGLMEAKNYLAGVEAGDQV